MSSLSERADRALGAFLSRTDTEHEWHRADRVTLLHCLANAAPAFFARHRLQPVLERALDGLAQISGEFPIGLPWERTMARLDALYFRALYGHPIPPLPQAAIAGCVADATRQSVLAGWLLAELAGALGVAIELPDPSSLIGAERTYWRSHQILLWSSYLRDELDTDATDALVDLARTLEVRLLFHEIDSAAEAIFCLAFAGRPVDASAIERLARHQRSDGSFAEHDADDEREQAHCTAVCLIALAQRA